MQFRRDGSGRIMQVVLDANEAADRGIFINRKKSSPPPEKSSVDPVSRREPLDMRLAKARDNLYGPAHDSTSSGKAVPMIRRADSLEARVRAAKEAIGK